MQTKDFQLKVKALQDTGEFTALAAEYGIRDLQNDVIERGAFARAIHQTAAAGIPLLWAHDQAQPVGKATLQDAEKGPLVHGSLDRTDPAGELCYSRVKKGLARGVSIGFLTPNPDAIRYDAAGVRHLTEIQLMEISLVVIPAQPGAQILEVRSLGDAARVIGGFDSTRMAAPELAALKSIETHVKRLLGAHQEPAPDAAILADLRDLARVLRPN